MKRTAGEALVRHGAELFGFVTAVLGDRRSARRVYTAVSEQLEPIPPRVAARTWMYALARRALASERAARGDVDRASSDPLPYRTSGTTSPADLLRAGLAPADLELIVLRVSRRLHWRELAITSIGPAPDAALEREARRLRERFRLLKTKLARRAARHGILSA